MTFSREWDVSYKKNSNISVWPWSDLVSYVMRYARPKPQSCVLELGCGAGANIPFFMSLGVKYYAIEGSVTMIKRLKKKFPKLKDDIILGDFTHGIPFQENFDLIVDRSSVTHNPEKSIRQCLEHVRKKLKHDGMYIGTDWFSTLHSEYKKGKKDEDPYTRIGYLTGQFANVGRVHFSDKSHIEDLFEKFSILVLEHKIVKAEIPKNNKIFAVWNIVAQNKR